MRMKGVGVHIVRLGDEDLADRVNAKVLTGHSDSSSNTTKDTSIEIHVMKALLDGNVNLEQLFTKV